jgi:hypothetical protein
VTRVLAAAVVVAQLLDLVTWFAMPRAAEVNPIAQGLHTQSAWVAKGALVVLVLAIQPLLRPKYSAVGELVAVVAIAAGCVGAGSNLAVLSFVAADEAPTSATQPAPVTSGGTGNEQGTQAPAAGSRTPAPRPSAIAATVRGRASWYGVDGDVAAAGPALRHGHWRGSLVDVCADRCVTVRLVDFCQCLRGQRSERVIDLSPSAFALLAPLSAGLIHVTVRRVQLVPPATDR